MSELDALERQIRQAMRVDQHRLRQRLRSLRRAAKKKQPWDRNAASLRRALEESVTRRRERLQRRPEIDYSGLSLPVLDRKDDIAEAIRAHQVVVICGETGSGKSTQLPKIALEIGHGIGGLIGHTQPRRIAARSIAARLAEELNCSVGGPVGYKVRFADVTRPDTYIKLMTDGILLAETASDRFLDAYDTIIIDEAHERSLNIDFLLGYLRRLLPKRRDLRLIITSATIDAERFQAHFQTPQQDVPIIEVSGRTYPVEVRYRPMTDDPVGEQRPRRREWQDCVVDALDEVCLEGPGDVLVFLPTERDIREVSRRLRGRLAGCDVLPLYGRLSAKEQSRVFAPSKSRRIVLATNVAESSVTVPGIRYVVDTGTARISRYSSRSRIQRLPIEAVSRASADQRKGRCGRVGPGICIRLFDENDYTRRDEYTQPEILRSNLASVILRAKALRLGPVEDFPFVDPPRSATIRDGYRTLFELGATDESQELTRIGRTLSRLPVDPRIGRMILAAIDEHCLHEVLIIASVLEIQDPRDRPVEKQQAADEAHERFRHEESDFLTLLNVWNFFHEQKSNLSHSRLRKACLQSFLNYNRMREWADLHRQLRDLVERSDDRRIRDKARSLRGKKSGDYDAIHRSLLPGLLSGVAFKADEADYTGADQVKLSMWPGSVLAAKKPRWIVASELVETTRRYARTVARINPNWIEPLAGHLVSRSHSEPHWHVKSSSVMAFEKVSLFGMTVVARRRVPFATVDPEVSREILIRAGLVEGELETKAPFFEHNRALMEEIEAMQARTRRMDLTPDEEIRYAFYDRLIPKDVCSGSQFEKWRKRAESRNPRLLFFRRDDFLQEEDATTARAGFPDNVEIGANRFPLEYNMEPGAEDDGITISVPRAGLAHLPGERLGWLVPGLLEEKVCALIKSLPKHLRRRLVPAPDTARLVVEQLSFGAGRIETEVAARLTRIAGEPVVAEDFDLDRLPRHLRMNVRVLDDDGGSVTSGRDVEQLQRATPREDLPTAVAGEWTQDGLTDWTLDELPRSVEIVQAGMRMPKFPAFVDAEEAVNLRLFDDAATANQELRGGLRRLFLLRESRRIRGHLKHFPDIDRIRLVCSAIPGMRIDSQLAALLAERAVFFEETSRPTTKAEFDALMKLAVNRLSVALQDTAGLLPDLFGDYQETHVLATADCPPAWQPAYADAATQLQQLVRPGFLIATPWAWLSQFPRYLEAIRYRLDRLPQGSLNTDQRGLREIESFERRYAERRTDHERRGIHDPELVTYRWMLEEYRVSLFAQKLGTAVPVSAKRLERQWKKTLA